MKYSLYKRNPGSSNGFSANTPSGSLPEDKKQIFNFQNSRHRSSAETGFPRSLAVLLLITEIVSVVIVSGCSGSGQQSSSATSSSSDSEISQSSVSAPAAVSKAKAAAPVSSVQSSKAPVSSPEEYALPASSQSASPAPEAPAQSAPTSAPASNAPAQAASQATERTDAQSILQSIFGDETGTDSDNVQLDSSGPRISMVEYDKVQEDMSYDNVKAIIGSDGKLTRESGVKGSDMYTETYQWSGSGTSDSYALMTFEGGKLDMKIQFGLE